MSREIMVKLQSSDHVVFEVEKSVAQESEMIKACIEDCGTEATIRLPNVSTKILVMVIEYARYHVDARKSSDERQAVSDEEIKKWDVEFITVDQYTLYDLIMAANYLDYKQLLYLGCQVVADLIKARTMEEIREIFNLEIDFTPEEEEQIRRENQWAFE